MAEGRGEDEPRVESWSAYRDHMCLKAQLSVVPEENSMIRPEDNTRESWWVAKLVRHLIVNQDKRRFDPFPTSQIIWRKNLRGYTTYASTGISPVGGVSQPASRATTAPFPAPIGANH